MRLVLPREERPRLWIVEPIVFAESEHLMPKMQKGRIRDRL